MIHFLLINWLKWSFIYLCFETKCGFEYFGVEILRGGVELKFVGSGVGVGVELKFLWAGGVGVGVETFGVGVGVELKLRSWPQACYIPQNR